MKIISAAAKAVLSDGSAIVVGAVKIETVPVIRVWGGNGPLTLPGEAAPFLPVGDRSLVQVMGGALGGAAQSITLSLSGIEPDTIAVDDSDSAAGAPTTLWRLIFSGDGTQLLDAHVWQRGRLDEITREDEVGGTAMISAILETAARGLGRSGARMRSDADQRLVKPTDGFFKHASFAGEKTLYWGGRVPANAGTALGAYTGGGSSVPAPGGFGNFGNFGQFGGFRFGG
jgi:hypothetical protein